MPSAAPGSQGAASKPSRLTRLYRLGSALVLGGAVQVARQAGPDHAISCGLTAASNRTGEETKSAGRPMSTGVVRQIQTIPAAKAGRTPVQRKVSSQLLEAHRDGAGCGRCGGRRRRRPQRGADRGGNFDGSDAFPGRQCRDRRRFERVRRSGRRHPELHGIAKGYRLRHRRHQWLHADADAADAAGAGTDRGHRSGGRS